MSKLYTSRIGHFLTSKNELVGEFAHCTITFLGPLDEKTAKTRFTELEGFFSEKKSVNFSVTGEDNFGPKNDIPVFLMELHDKELEGKLIKFHQTNGKEDHGFKNDVPVWHISKRNVKAQLSIGDQLTAHSVDIKQLGPFDPVHKLSL
jgi:hypothetical protein